MEALSAGADAPGGHEPRDDAAGRGAIVFIGFMGAGKTTAARSVAAQLGADPLDSDRALEQELGEPLEQFFDREGEEQFRAREEATVLALLERPDARVVALGGGALGSQRVREALRRHTVVLLEIEPEQAWRRASGGGRPLARDRRRFDELLAERHAVYEDAADAIVPPASKEASAAALPALLELGAAPPGTRLVWAVSAGGSYPVLFGRGLVPAGVFQPRDGRRFVVTDENVARHHAIESDWACAIPPGETEKTLARAEAVLREMARCGVERGDVAVALGGGVVGDLAGLCAALYQRGIRHVQVPSTLVAQVDSAYGGKTGVDLPEGKNYAGAYLQPSGVVCDPDLLGTLPPEELAAGYAEVVKTALIAGGPLWARVRQGGEVDDATILGCLRTKLAIVRADERDAGRRQVLNLGHTVAHAIEAATGYTRYRHGEAVAIGLLVALRLSERAALREEVARLLTDHGLPDRFSGAGADDVVELVQRDKKRAGGSVPFVLLSAPGEVTPGHDVATQDLRNAVEEVRDP